MLRGEMLTSDLARTSLAAEMASCTEAGVALFAAGPLSALPVCHSHDRDQLGKQHNRSAHELRLALLSIMLAGLALQEYSKRIAQALHAGNMQQGQEWISAGLMQRACDAPYSHSNDLF